ncbi:HIT-like domain-containing protein [Trichoderma barbatum]
MMQKIMRIFYQVYNSKLLQYLANLEWTERLQPKEECIFCDCAISKSIEKYENDQTRVVKNLRSAGQEHWLIMPQPELHVRDIENLDSTHLDLLRAMDDAKRRLLQEEYPDVPRSEIHSGYHRGRRPLIGNIFYPDIISIHHLHLHVIVRPRRKLLWLKYPPWLPLMWKSDDKVLREIEELSLKMR